MSLNISVSISLSSLLSSFSSLSTMR
jgi:hypothetical protein